MTNYVTQTSFDSSMKKIDARFTTLEMQVANLAIRFSGLEDRFVNYKSESDIKFDRIMNILDTHTGMLQDMLLELRARNNVFERHDRWIRQLAKKSEVKLAYNG